MPMFLIFAVLVAFSVLEPWGWSRYFVAAALLIQYWVVWALDEQYARIALSQSDRLSALEAQMTELESTTDSRIDDIADRVDDIDSRTDELE